MKNTREKKTDRREFLGALATGPIALGLTTVPSNGTLNAATTNPLLNVSDLDAWFASIKGKHRIVFDAASANEGFPVIWPYTFMTTNNGTGTPDEDLTAMVIFRSKAIPLALDDKIWAKFKLGKMFKLVDPETNASAERNLYWSPNEGEMPEPGMAVKALMSRGAMFCVCETAITMTSRMYSKSKGIDPEETKKEWVAGILPGIRLVPSGVWAVNRAQENGCSYCAAG